ncbi:MAG: hypothetical protein IJZ88_06225 [Clostridia bacterium]|nr:hypothetical protein [Clostridia bacterium]
MNFDELNSELGRFGISIPRLAEIVGIGKKAMYERFKGESQFKQGEILIIKKTLKLSDSRLVEIFFSD